SPSEQPSNCQRATAACIDQIRTAEPCSRMQVAQVCVARGPEDSIQGHSLLALFCEAWPLIVPDARGRPTCTRISEYDGSQETGGCAGRAQPRFQTISRS